MKMFYLKQPNSCKLPNISTIMELEGSMSALNRATPYYGRVEA